MWMVAKTKKEVHCNAHKNCIKMSQETKPNEGMAIKDNCRSRIQHPEAISPITIANKTPVDS